MHFVYKVGISRALFQDLAVYSYLHVREVRPDYTIHNTPHVGNGVLVVNLDTKLVSDQALGTLTTEKILCADGLNQVCIQGLQRDLDWIGWVRTIVLEARDCPGTLDSRSSFLNLLQEDSLDFALMHKSGKWVSGVDESGATGPAASPMDTFSVGEGVPESYIIHLGGLVCHDLAFETQVPKNLGRARLNTVCATSGGGDRAVVNMLDLVTPSRHAKGQQNPYRTCAHNDNIILLLRLGHTGSKYMVAGQLFR